MDYFILGSTWQPEIWSLWQRKAILVKFCGRHDSAGWKSRQRNLISNKTLFTPASTDAFRGFYLPVGFRMIKPIHNKHSRTTGTPYVNVPFCSAAAADPSHTVLAEDSARILTGMLSSSALPGVDADTDTGLMSKQTSPQKPVEDNASNSTKPAIIQTHFASLLAIPTPGCSGQPNISYTSITSSHKQLIVL